jgi:hypothetical protein
VESGVKAGTGVNVGSSVAVGRPVGNAGGVQVGGRLSGVEVGGACILGPQAERETRISRKDQVPKIFRRLIVFIENSIIFRR